MDARSENAACGILSAAVAAARGNISVPCWKDGF